MMAGSPTPPPDGLRRVDDVPADIVERRRFESFLIDLAGGFVHLEAERVDEAIEDTATRQRSRYDRCTARLLGFHPPLPGCVGGGVFQEGGESGTALYVEMWQTTGLLEAHVRSREYHRLLAIMETAAERPALCFN